MMNLPNANRTMDLLTKALMKKIPALGSQDGKGEDTILYAKFFLNEWTWFLTEMDPNTLMCFGKVFSGHCPEGELGYFNLKELASLRGPIGNAVERDRFFDPVAIKNCTDHAFVK